MWTVKRFLGWFIGLPIALVIIALSVANRDKVTFSFDPFSRTDPLFALDLPLYALLLAAGFVGLVCGGITSWVSQARWRRAARQARAEGMRLRREAEALKRRAAEPREALMPPTNRV
jgi:uncharacterized integral membrane protein